MSQVKVNSFFKQRKGISNGHASKRRKLDGLSADLEVNIDLNQGSDTDTVKQVPDHLIPIPTATTVSGVSLKTRSGRAGSEEKNQTNRFISKPKSKSVTETKGTASSQVGRKSRSRRTANAVNAKSKAKVQAVDSQQQKLTDHFNFVPVTSITTASSCSSSPNPCSVESLDMSAPIKGIIGSSDPVVSKQSKSMEFQEEVTSFLDDHISLSNREGMSTPRKKIITVENTLSQGPVSRKRKTAVRKLKNENRSRSRSSHQVDPKSETEAVDIRKKLILDAADTDDKSPSCRSIDDQQTSSTSRDKNLSDSALSNTLCGKSDLLAAVSEISESQDVISPLAKTPEHPYPSSPLHNYSSPKLHDLSEKLQALSKMNGKALKNRLKQKGLLKDYKEKLGDLTKAVVESAEESTISSGNVDEKEKDLPAYQQFDYLAKEGPPTLSLPFSYRLLEGAFQAMDTVVSMLHNRSEICTFSKLKSAVQNQTRKNFEEKTAGQIKTVVPDAYLFRQEKNLPSYGQKKSGYQLTVEAIIKDQDSTTNFTKDGKPSFSIKLMQKRRAHFRQRLLNFVKQHHKKFLASLSPPLNIPDSKLSRWHPRFHLDEVPAIPTSDLPQPPDAKICRSAQDVLDIMQKGKTNPRVEQALLKVIADTKSDSKENSTSSSSQSVKPSPSKETTSSLKGIPPALLAKIRAKEALKMEEALTRNPLEDKKTKMMGRLPEIIRILRSYFVTEKKTAIQLDVIFKKLEDSFKSGMALGDIEQHINLLKELAPEFVSVVEVKKGKYLKLDKNVDANTVSSRITNLVKSKQ